MSFMDILKARDIDPILYQEAKKINISEQDINNAYDILEKDYVKELISRKVKGVKKDNPLSYKFESMNQGKVMFPRIMQELVSNLSLGNVDLKNFSVTENEIKEIGKLKNILQRLTIFGKDITIGSKKKKVVRSEKRQDEVSKLLQDILTVVAKNGFRLEDEDVQVFKDKFEEVDINKIVSFFLDGKPLRQLHSVLLEDSNAKWDDSEENWMVDGQIAYKNYSGKNSKELFNEIVEGYYDTL